MRSTNLIAYSFIFVILLLLDQATKLYLIEHIKTLPEQQITILPFFNLVYSWNHGISFGMFSEYEYSNILFLVLNSCIILYLCYHSYEITDSVQRMAIYLIITGALGNLIDRGLHGAVFDFLHFHFGEYVFPTFNIADMYVSIGAFLYVLRAMLAAKCNDIN